MEGFDGAGTAGVVVGGRGVVGGVVVGGWGAGVEGAGGVVGGGVGEGEGEGGEEEGEEGWEVHGAWCVNEGVWGGFRASLGVF